MNASARTLLTSLICSALVLGCSTKQPTDETIRVPKPDYSRPLPPGQSALRLITDPGRLPDLGMAWRSRDVLLLDALDHSATWFAAPSSKTFFPFETITHAQAAASVRAMQVLVERAASETDFVAQVREQFDIYESVGYDGSGIVLYTGYYSPDFRASRTRTGEFTAPLYMRPIDLVTDPRTGDPKGRELPDGRVVPCPTREEIEATNLYAGSELAYVQDKLSAFLIHVNGSAKLRLPDGTLMYIGYAGKTDQPYGSLGRAMIKAGLLDEDGASIPAIRRVYRRDPEMVEDLMKVNKSYVFFTEYAGENWPSGSLGVRVTPERSLATDKKIYPRGGVVLVNTETINFTGGRTPFYRFMLDQDTGGAIVAPGRADLFLGIGERVGILAGSQYAEGRLYYFFLKPEYVDRYPVPTPVALREPDSGS